MNFPRNPFDLEQVKQGMRASGGILLGVGAVVLVLDVPLFDTVKVVIAMLAGLAMLIAGSLRADSGNKSSQSKTG